MRVEKILIFFSMFVLLLAACTPSAVSGPTPGSAQSEPPAQVTTAIGETPAPSNVEKTAVNAAIAALMQEVKVDATQVKIAAVEAVDWPNACLGAAKPNEMCAEVVTPGYKIMLQAGGKTYEYHINQDGSQIRGLTGTTSKDAPAGGAQSPTQVETPAASIPAPAKAAQQALAKQLGVAADQVRIASVEQVDWPDGCLGIQRPGIMCTQIIVPGYRVILEASGKQYEFRTGLRSARRTYPMEPAAER